jgi:UDP-N-acetylmuramoylalanine--D-glutamate ligase
VAAKPRPALPPPPYLVVGLARSGVAAALALRAADGEARVIACDSARPAEALEQEEGLRAAGVEVHMDTDGTELLVADPPPRTVVKSPGVPVGAAVVARARELGMEVVGELEIGWRLLPNEFIAVTGTNGKTTTTELIGAIHRQAGLAVAVAGNVGMPVSALPGHVGRDVTVACETSSFQLEDSPAFAPEVAVFLNFSADHLDRHGTIDSYLDAKLSVFVRQTEDDVAVLNDSEPVLSRRQVSGAAQRVWFGKRPDSDLRVDEGRIVWRGSTVMSVSDVRLRGPHNLENAMAAATAALARGVEQEAVAEALRDFGGVPHRLEEVEEIDGVLYVNDSKATNVSAAAAALRSFDGGVHAILGGSLKGGDFAGLAGDVAEHCRRCYLIGEAQERLEHDLQRAGVDLVPCGDLDHAVAEASRSARSGETVLLAPACASFDQYRDYEQRGEHFRSLVRALRGRGDGDGP